MGIMDDLNAGVNSAVKACKDGSESIKNKARISEQARTIEKMTSEIGNLILLELDKGEKMTPAIMERYDVIVSAREVIEEAKTEKNGGFKICPFCEKRNINDMEYCGYCGMKLETPEDMDE